MIYDNLAGLGRYKGILRNLDTAIDYLSGRDLGGLETGKYPIDGERVFMLVQAYDTKRPETADYEYHRRYLDIQLALSGEEICYHAPLAELEPRGEFEPERDIGFLGKARGPELGLPLVPGRVAIFFPQDAHKPGCEARGKQAMRKIVVKVEVL